MRSPSLIVIAVFLARQASSLDLRLDIAGGNCHNVEEFDETFDDGIMPGTQEMMDITTTTQREDAEKEFGFSVFRGASNNDNDNSNNATTATAEEGDDSIIDRGPGERALQLPVLNCPIYRECPGAGDPTHWCTWICGYWSEHTSTRAETRRSADGGDGLRMLRRVTKDLQIPDAELEPILEPILYSSEDRELMISIEGLVCGWIQRWLDSRFSRCLNGAALQTCELNLRS